MSVFQVLFSPTGRIRRSTYWLYSIGLGIGILVIEMGLHLSFGLNGQAFFTDLTKWIKGDFSPFSTAAMVLTILFVYPSFCISVKRWHDRNRSVIAAIFVFLCGWGSTIIQVRFGDTAAHPNLLISSVATLISFGISIWAFIECGCLDGTPGPNRYGPSPKGKGVSPAAVF